MISVLSNNKSAVKTVGKTRICITVHTHRSRKWAKYSANCANVKRCYNHSSVTGLVKSSSWIVKNDAAVIFGLWPLFKYAVNRDFLALRSVVIEVFVLQGCDTMSYCNRFLKIRYNEISSCTFPSLKTRPLRCFESWERHAVTRCLIYDERTL